MVTRSVNDGRRNKDDFVAVTGEDGKKRTIDPVNVTDIREV